VDVVAFSLGFVISHVILTVFFFIVMTPLGFDRAVLRERFLS